MKLLVFAFSNTIAAQVAKRLDIQANKLYIDSTEEAVATFVSDTDFDTYNLVLGLGMYSGRDQDELRIETICTNQFRNRSDNVEQVAIPYFIQPKPGIKLAKGIGNSWCNLVSYSLLGRYPQVHYTFLHIPKTFDPQHASAIVKGRLVDYEPTLSTKGKSNF